MKIVDDDEIIEKEEKANKRKRLWKGTNKHNNKE